MFYEKSLLEQEIEKSIFEATEEGRQIALAEEFINNIFKLFGFGG